MWNIRLQAPTLATILDKNVGKNGRYMSSFKIKLLKALAATNTPPFPPKRQCWSLAGSFLIPTKQLWPGWGKWRDHIGTKSAGYVFCWSESTKFLTLFVQDCRNCDISPWFCCGIDTQTRTVTLFSSYWVTMQLVGGNLSCQQVVLVLFSCCCVRK